MRGEGAQQDRPAVWPPRRASRTSADGVENAQTGVEPDNLGRERRLGLEQRV
jgi:hypothetical protein